MWFKAVKDNGQEQSSTSTECLLSETSCKTEHASVSETLLSKGWEHVYNASSSRRGGCAGICSVAWFYHYLSSKARTIWFILSLKAKNNLVYLISIGKNSMVYNISEGNNSGLLLN